MTILAPIDGIVLKQNVALGEYVQTGSALFEIADLSRVWIFLQVYEKDVAEIQIGLKVSFFVQAFPVTTFSAHVNFIDPAVDEKSRTIKIRAMAKNSDNTLKPGLLVNAEFIVPSKTDELLVPASAVLLTGKCSIVYVALGDGIFKGREIIVRNRVGDAFVVKSSLNGNERVFTNGAFKIDSEMQIKAKKSMMNPTGLSSSSPAHSSPNNISETSGKEYINELLVAIAQITVSEPIEKQWQKLATQAEHAAQIMKRTENITTCVPSLKNNLMR